MSSVIDIEKLVAPITDANPCGADPRDNTGFDSSYHKLKDAREIAMSSERPDKSAQPTDGVESGSIDTASWTVVVEEASNILVNEAKDLEVCALLIEGLARLHGPAGIRDGFLVTAQIVQNYWDGLYPEIDPVEEDSLEDRLIAFSGLNGIGQPGTLATYIAKLPITDTYGDNYRSYDYERAYTVNSIPEEERREEQQARLGFTLVDIENAAQDTSASFYQGTIDAVSGAQEALTELDKAFTDACGYDAPPTSMITEAFTKLSDIAKNLGGDRLVAPPSEETEEEGEAESADGSAPAGAAAGKPATPTGAITSRDDAIARLRTVAKYFRDTEPHSPLSYSLQNVIRWAQLPLDRLLEEWISDEHARERYMLMTGIRPGAGDEE